MNAQGISIHVPDDIIRKILSFTDVLNVLRMRLVSKRFREITYDREIWATLYTNAPLPRPPGPFPSQSTQFLERTLAKSTRLAQSWTTQPLQEIWSADLPLSWLQCQPPGLVGGRWVIDFESSKKIVLHDTTDLSSRKVVWEVPDGETIHFWELCPITSTNGALVYVVVFKKPTLCAHSICELLEFRISDDSVELSFSVELRGPPGSFEANTDGMRDKGPLLFIEHLHLVFDTRTRIVYGFPEFRTQLDEITPLPDDTGRRALLTNTHIIILSPHTPPYLLIQAFAIPAHPRQLPNGPSALQLTHECISTDALWVHGQTLIRESTVDPLTGSTNMRFLGHLPKGGQLGFHCIDLTLPASHDDTILPISLAVHEVFTLEPFFQLTARNTGYLFITASDDGYARGFYGNAEVVFNTGMPLNLPFYATKFTVDATQRTCVAVVGERSHLASPNHIEELPTHASFDGARGVLCYGKGPMMGPHGYFSAHVVHIR